MATLKPKKTKIEDTVVGAYQKIEDTVVGTYQKIEDVVVGTYQKIEDKFVEKFIEGGNHRNPRRRRRSSEEDRQGKEQSVIMKTVTVIFEEPLHHVCLMYGLKQTFGRMPFLNKRVLEVRGKHVVIDNPTAPPPMMNNPTRRKSIRGTRNMVAVSYWKNKLSIEYREDMCSQEDITAFVNNLIEDYLRFRHPFMKLEIIDGRCHELSSGNLIAEIK